MSKKIQVEKQNMPEGYRFYIPSNDPNINEASVEVVAEHGGHGCLHEVRLPSSLSTGYSSQDEDTNSMMNANAPKLEDILIILNHILKGWNYPYRIVKNFDQVESI